jgi:CRISPR-associated protein Csd1
MNWMQNLYETYNNCEGNDSIPDANELCPVGYSVQNAHINIILDEEGNFLRASIVPKEDAKTLIPVTEKSLTGRTSGIAPHALCDSIQYCASDYPKYGGKRSSYFDSYIKQLESWATPPFSHPKVKAVYAYVKKGTVVRDLIKQGILPIEGETLKIELKGSDEKNSFPIMKLLSFDDKGVKDPAKVFIRWSIESSMEVCSETWKDSSLFESWRKFLDTQESSEGFCYVTGKEVTLAQKHPARLRNGKDSAKLISSNDTSGYTFLGRFTTAGEAVGVSSEVTQKAHSALRWLIGRKQAFRNGDQIFASWAINGVDIPDPYSNTFDFLGQQKEMPNNKKAMVGDVGQSFALRLNQKIAGYKANVNDSVNIITMGLDSVTPGRMSIVFYRELTGSEFLKRIEQWHSDFAWVQNFGNDKRFIGAPSPKDIAWAA